MRSDAGNGVNRREGVRSVDWDAFESHDSFTANDGGVHVCSTNFIQPTTHNQTYTFSNKQPEGCN